MKAYFTKWQIAAYFCFEKKNREKDYTGVSIHPFNFLLTTSNTCFQPFLAPWTEAFLRQTKMVPDTILILFIHCQCVPCNNSQGYLTSQTEEDHHIHILTILSLSADYTVCAILI